MQQFTQSDTFSGGCVNPIRFGTHQHSLKRILVFAAGSAMRVGECWDRHHGVGVAVASLVGEAVAVRRGVDSGGTSVSAGLATALVAVGVGPDDAVGTVSGVTVLGGGIVPPPGVDRVGVTREVMTTSTVSGKIPSARIFSGPMTLGSIT